MASENIYFNSKNIVGVGNLGIGGVTGPLAPLHTYYGTFGIPDTTGAGTSNVGSRFQLGAVALDMGVVTSGNVWLQNHSINGWNLNYPLLLNPNGGNIGIGTTTPGYTLTSAGTICGPYSSIPLLACYNQSVGTFPYANVISCGYLSPGRDSTQIFTPGSSGNGGAPVMTLQAGNFVGIGNTNPVSALSVQGSIWSSTLTSGATTLSVDAAGNIIRTPSDARLKTNVESIAYGLNTVNAFRPVSYEWIDKEKYGIGRSIGLIAQDVRQLVPEAVSGGETLSLDYPKLVPVLAKAIQELSVKNTALEQSLATATATANINSLKTRLDSVEARLTAAGL